MNLPAELRIKIWTYVLGDRLIVVNSVKVFGNLHSHTSDNDEAPSHLRSVAHRLRRTWGLNTIERYHSLKSRARGPTKALEYYTRSDISRIATSAIDLHILLANRQIHSEAFHVLWTTNQFLFHRPIPFHIFTRCLSHTQKHTLARIRIQITLDPRTEPKLGWHNLGLDHNLAENFPALKDLHIHLIIASKPGKCPWIYLDDLHTHPTIRALSSCVQTTAAILMKLKISLDRDSQTTRFLWPQRLFDSPSSAYYGVIKTRLVTARLTWPWEQVFKSNYYGSITWLEIFYGSYILHHPDVGKVTEEFRERVSTRRRGGIVLGGGGAAVVEEDG
ncbi:MAG: hypothetical protein Q9168_008169 [Polycauliona sp. 1 TL-2023]